ncbi:TraY domain-containing protein [Vibrio mediterranei]
MTDPTRQSVGGVIKLDQQAYHLLTKASEQSYRSLRQEATLRIIDHANRFESTPQQENPTEIVWCADVKIPIAVKQRLNKSLYRGQYKVKTLVDEYSLRLKDHLLRYPTISAVGVAQEGTHCDT